MATGLAEREKNIEPVVSGKIAPLKPIDVRIDVQGVPIPNAAYVMAKHQSRRRE